MSSVIATIERAQLRRVPNFAPGDRVLGALGFGAAREKIVCPVDRLVKIPDGLSDEKAAGLTTTSMPRKEEAVPK